MKRRGVSAAALRECDCSFCRPRPQTNRPHYEKNREEPFHSHLPCGHTYTLNPIPIEPNYSSLYHRLQFLMAKKSYRLTGASGRHSIRRIHYLLSLLTAIQLKENKLWGHARIIVDGRHSWS